MPEAGECFGFSSPHERMARVCPEEKTGAKPIETAAIIAVGNLQRTSLKPSLDPVDIATLRASHDKPSFRHRHKLNTPAASLKTGRLFLFCWLQTQPAGFFSGGDGGPK